MKKIILITAGLLGVAMSYAYMRPANPYTMYYGPEVEQERAQGAAYVPPDREFVLIPCLNDSDEHVEMLYNIINEEICLKK